MKSRSLLFLFTFYYIHIFVSSFTANNFVRPLPQYTWWKKNRAVRANKFISICSCPVIKIHSVSPRNKLRFRVIRLRHRLPSYRVTIKSQGAYNIFFRVTEEKNPSLLKNCNSKFSAPNHCFRPLPPTIC